MASDILPVLERIWTKWIRDDYCAGLLVSESSLMSAFYHHARNEFAAWNGISVFTEPTLWWGTGAELAQHDSRHCKPDLVIGRQGGDRRVAAAVIEFKYAPFTTVLPFETDIGKLVRLEAARNAYAAMITPATGKELVDSDIHHLQVCDDTLLVFAAIARKGSSACDVSLRDIASPSRNFHHFHGSIAPGTEPHFEVTAHA
jgi:hypothetical protein